MKLLDPFSLFNTHSAQIDTAEEKNYVDKQSRKYSYAYSYAKRHVLENAKQTLDENMITMTVLFSDCKVDSAFTDHERIIIMQTFNQMIKCLRLASAICKLFMYLAPSNPNDPNFICNEVTYEPIFKPGYDAMLELEELLDYASYPHHILNIFDSRAIIFAGTMKKQNFRCLNLIICCPQCIMIQDQDFMASILLINIDRTVDIKFLRVLHINVSLYLSVTSCFTLVTVYPKGHTFCFFILQKLWWGHRMRP
ncbi:MAG: hypothetical protein KAH18_00715 [Psychromonas sp.]|nr:hypothetical protein [Psychromonas sp.]